ncbi:hypothetical protein CK215_26455 [Mesorhizobium sp. WSM3864]|uniref:hypothetical protein n=1 Tax=Mesorhizobium sp. WSM3864 TaxID=2029404 RepID=UPI000BAE9ECA|nr:hypothetical protein [Mesorhizobium sp. WSM3864]PBB89587.1 hypothetical protein CK215_26455 [Mesorhizobium sp. WSM3864]
MKAGDGKPDGSHRDKDIHLLAARLAKETSVSEEEARELIRLIGTDWSSLVREAKFLKSRH